MSPLYASLVVERQLECFWAGCGWRVAINTEKSGAICFIHKSTSKCILFPWKADPSLLGRNQWSTWLYRARHLNFKNHMTETLKKAEGVWAALFHMLSCHNRLAVCTCLMIYLLFLWSIITYAAPIWWSLLSITNKCRWCVPLLGCPLFIRKDVIQRELRTPLLSDFFLLAITLVFTVWMFPYLQYLCADQHLPPPPS